MKKVLSIILSSVIALSIVGCGQKASTTQKEEKGLKIIKVGATPVPHKEILDKIKPELEKKGYKLEVKEFTDYQLPNAALASKDLDANFFQHVPFLDKQNAEKKYDLTYTVKVHLEPLGFYSKKITKIEDLKDGAKIAVPNDPTNEARALRLLESKGLIKVKAGDLITIKDITENTKKLEIKELDAAQLPRVLQDIEGAVINTNFALEAKLNPAKDSLVLESKDSPYANILAVRKDNKDSDAIKALSEALTSDTVKKFLEDKYKGSIVPSF